MRFLGHGSSIHGSDLAGQRIIPIEEPDALVAHVRFWGEGGGAIPSLTRQPPPSRPGRLRRQPHEAPAACGRAPEGLIWGTPTGSEAPRRAMPPAGTALGPVPQREENRHDD